MKRLLLILILTLSFQTWTKADDISDFQIEGMSIGDSALDYFSKSKILSGKSFTYKDKKYKGRYIKANSNKYDQLQFHFLKDDNKYIIHAIGGMKDFKFNIKDCYLEIDQIIVEISNTFKSIRFNNKNTKSHAGDSSGKSKTTSAWFYFPDGSSGFVGCYDWSKEMAHTDQLRIVIQTSELTNWLRYKAHK
tara:strand:- start:338 stop:910 length:573 start_codon:yes stop_codon:yes gene_type:complete